MAALASVLLFVVSRQRESASPGESRAVEQPSDASTSSPEVAGPGSGTNRSSRPQGTYRLGRGNMSDAELAEFNATFEKKLKPAVERWCMAYAGHVPFEAGALTMDTFSAAVGRGPRCMYMFVLDGMTVGIEDADRGVLLTHLNTPNSKKLVQLPRGTVPDPSMPVTREEVARLLKVDSGVNFPPAEIRVTPTAFSGAMNGGAQVSVGGDPINSASWKFTLVFGADGKLAYYLRSR